MSVWLAAAAAVLLVAVSGRGALARQVSRRVRDLTPDPGSGRRRPPIGWLLTLGLGSGTALVAGGMPAPVVVLALAAFALLARLRAGTVAGRRREEYAAAVAEVTTALAAELRAGRTAPDALRAVAPWAGPLQPALEAAARAAAVGASPADVLVRAATPPGAERLRHVAAVWAVSERTGGQVAAALERLAEAMDGDDELRHELDGALAGPRATMVLLAGLPLLGIGLGQSVGAQPLRLLLHQPVGWALLAAASALDALGVLVTRRITSAALGP
jgi:tight adherence protein B